MCLLCASKCLQTEINRRIKKWHRILAVSNIHRNWIARITVDVKRNQFAILHFCEAFGKLIANMQRWWCFFFVIQFKKNSMYSNWLLGMFLYSFLWSLLYTSVGFGYFFEWKSSKCHARNKMRTTKSDRKMLHIKVFEWILNRYFHMSAS